MRRRDFLETLTIGAGVLAGMDGRRAEAKPGRSYPHKTFQDACRAAGFDPAATGSQFFVVVADCHYGQCRADGLMPVIAELNAMDPRPAFFLIDGDMACTASLSFGARPNQKQQATAVEEFKSLKRHLARLDRNIAIKLALGNHDTPPGELDPEIFWKVFPESPAYQAFDLAGTRCVILNGHNNGHLDAKQADWLAREASRLDQNREVIAFVHQPSLGSVSNERGIAPPIKRAFARHEGPMWLVCGHCHSNGQSVFALPKTTIVQASVVNSTAGVWGGSETPGYWAYCVRDGRVRARIFRRLGHGFRVAPMPDRSRAKPIPVAFEHSEGVLWKLLVAPGERPYLVSQKAADVETYWFYVTELTYRLPLEKTGGRATRFAVLGNFMLKDPDGSALGCLRVSGDGQTWQDVPLPKPSESVYSCEIPTALRGGKSLYVQVRATDAMRHKPTVAGFALLE